jgi:hypothetical protein
MTQVIAPYVTQQGRVESYISIEEFKFSATASAIDFTNLVANGAQAAQDRALYELIVRASSKIDVFCMGKLGTLNSTVNSEQGRYRMDRKGRFKVHPSFGPVTAINDFAWGPLMGSLNTVPITVNNAWPEQDSIVFQAFGAANVNYFAGMQAFNYIVSGQPYDGEFYTQFTYTSGYPNSFTTATSNAGDTTLSLKDVTGLYPLMNNTVWDGVNDEYIQIASNYVPGTNPITLTSPLLYKHGSGVNVSTLPAIVKQACIHFTVAMVKQRGQGGFVLNEIGEPTAVTGKSETSMEDEIKGYDLLDEFKSVWSRS